MLNAAEPPTFAACWQAYWHVKEPQLSNGKHRDQCVSTMLSYVLPHIGTRPIAGLNPGAIIELLKPIWQPKEATARRGGLGRRLLAEHAAEIDEKFLGACALLQAAVAP